MKKLIAATFMTLLTITSFYHTNEDSSNSDFERWAKQHGKIYYGDEKTFRQAIYYQNKQMIEEHNKRTDVTYQMGENQFTAYTNEEFINLFLHPRPSQTLNDENETIMETTPQSPQPNKEQKIKQTVDWRGLVKVKNQGNCASDYATTATSVIEGEYAIIKGINVTLSAQNIVDCNFISSGGCYSGSYGNDVWNALNYVFFNGIYSEQQYPYNGIENWCQVDISTKGPYSFFREWRVEPGLQENEIENHPITTYVDASKWQFYKSGIFSDCNSDYYKQNYFALIVGFYRFEYWIVQPSFGTGWGESGYIRIKPENSCGIAINIGYMIQLEQ